MENKISLLNLNRIKLTPELELRIPTVGEILENEQAYYSIISSLTASSYQYMVQLDDMGIDYTTISDYELFLMLFPKFAKGDLSILFGTLETADFEVYQNRENAEAVVYSPQNQIMIDRLIYQDLSDLLRKINLIEKQNAKPGNDSARKYLLEKERKKQKRSADKAYEPYLEKMVIALVNTYEFPYNYQTCLDLTVYQFNQSLKQIQHKINFDHTMAGVYAGTVDTSKMNNKEALTWFPTSN